MTRSTPPAPNPKPPKPAGQAEPTDSAELNIVLLPRKGARMRIRVRGDQSERLIAALEHLGIAALCVAALVGTLYGAAAAHLAPALTTLLAGAELLTMITGLMIWRRTKTRNRQKK